MNEITDKKKIVECLLFVSSKPVASSKIASIIGNAAEDESSRRITLEHTKKAIDKFDKFSIKNFADLTEDEQFILNLIKSSSGMRIGELFRTYQEKGGEAVYKTFQRKIKKLYENNFINIEKKTGGKDGSTTILNYGSMKKLSEY